MYKVLTGLIKANGGRYFFQIHLIVFLCGCSIATVNGCPNNEQYWRRLFWNLNCRFWKIKIVVLFSENKKPRPQLLVLANSITRLPPEILSDITFILSLLKHVWRWQVSWRRSIIIIRLLGTYKENIRGLLKNSDIRFKNFKIKRWSQQASHSEPFSSIGGNQPISFKKWKTPKRYILGSIICTYWLSLGGGGDICRTYGPSAARCVSPAREPNISWSGPT